MPSFKGVQLAKRLQLQHLIIIGDSKNTIRSMIKGATPNVYLSNIIKKDNLELASIPRSHFTMSKGKITNGL
jgi:hypothetical protein